MKYVPLWKVRRELLRPFRQISNLPERISSRLLGSAYYDLFLSEKAHQFDGTLPVAGKVAVYVIFPTTGLLGSHIAAIQYLRKGGYAPLVVSNLSLSDTDRAQLRDNCWRWIERPNFGYDFGGYRDGVLTAVGEVPDLKSLVLVNDSCWFPLPGAEDWLAQAEAMQRDFVGAATNYGHPRLDSRQYREIKWNYCTTHKNFHYCSFALLISQRVLQDRAFTRFWKRFPLSNKKNLAVRRGEIGLTKWILSRGYSHGTPHDIAGLDATLAALGDRDLTTVARNIIIPEAPRLSELKTRLIAGYHDRWDLEALILITVALQGSSYVLTTFLHQHCGYAFLKKSPVWLNPAASDLTIEFVRRLEGPFGQTILQEALELRTNRALSFKSIEP